MISPILSFWHCQGSWVWSTHPFTLLTLLDIRGKSGILQALAAKESRDSWWIIASCVLSVGKLFWIEQKGLVNHCITLMCKRLSISHTVPLQQTRMKSLDHHSCVIPGRLYSGLAL